MIHPDRACTPKPQNPKTPKPLKRENQNYKYNKNILIKLKDELRGGILYFNHTINTYLKK